MDPYLFFQKTMLEVQFDNRENICVRNILYTRVSQK